MNFIDLRPLVDQVVVPFLSAFLVPLAGAAATWALYKLGAAAHMTISQGQAAKVENAMQNAVTLVLGRAQAAADTSGARVAVDQPMIAAAIGYVNQTVLPEMRALKIDPGTLGARLEARIQARVPGVAPAQLPVAPAQITPTQPLVVPPPAA